MRPIERNAAWADACGVPLVMSGQLPKSRIYPDHLLSRRVPPVHRPGRAGDPPPREPLMGGIDPVCVRCSHSCDERCGECGTLIHRQCAIKGCPGCEIEAARREREALLAKGLPAEDVPLLRPRFLGAASVAFFAGFVCAAILFAMFLRAWR